MDPVWRAEVVHSMHAAHSNDSTPQGVAKSGKKEAPAGQTKPANGRAAVTSNHGAASGAASQ